MKANLIEHDSSELDQLLDIMTDTIIADDDQYYLTIYLSTPPEERRGPGSTQIWEIELRHHIDDCRRYWQKRDPEVVAAVDAKLTEIEAVIADVVDPHGSGRSKILFTNLTPGADIHLLRTQMLMTTSVYASSKAHFGQALTISDEGRAAHALVFADGAAHLWEISMGVAELKEMIPLRMKTGNVHNSPLGDHRSRSGGVPEAKVDEIKRGFVAAVGHMIANEVDSDRLVIVGDPRDTSVITSYVPDGVYYSCLEQNLARTHENEIATRLAEPLAALNDERELALVEHAQAMAYAGANGAIGVDDVFGSLNEHRARIVLVDSSKELSGYYDPENGLLFSHNGQTGVRASTDLSEQIWLACHRSGAQLVPVEGAAATAMAKHDGIATLLYY